MRKFFATAFLLGITSVFPAQALDLSSIGQSAKPAGSSVMFQNDGENKKTKPPLSVSSLLSRPPRQQRLPRRNLRSFFPVPLKSSPSSTAKF